MFAARVVDEELHNDVFLQVDQKALQLDAVRGNFTGQNRVLQVLVDVEQQQKQNQEVVAAALLKHALQHRNFGAASVAEIVVCHALQRMLRQVQQVLAVRVAKHVAKKVAYICFACLCVVLTWLLAMVTLREGVGH